MGSIPHVSVLRGSNLQQPQIKFLHRLFEDNATKHSGIPAVIFRDVKTGSVHKLNYQELDRAANRLARSILKQLQARNSKPNSDGDWVLAVHMCPSDALILTLLAVWKIGAAYLPIDKCAPQSRIQHIVTEAKPALIITDAPKNEHGDLDMDIAVNFQDLDATATNMSAEIIEDHQILTTNGNHIGIILYTSGSTGVPKGVRIPHSAILNRLSWQWKEFPYRPNEHVCVFKTALTFVDAVSEIWGPLLSSDPRTVLVVPRDVTKDPERLISLLEEFKVQRLVLVPSLLRAMLMYLKLADNKNGPTLLSALQLWVCSGEPLPYSLVVEFFHHFKNFNHILCNFYGSTEIMGDVTYFAIHSSADLVSFDNKVPIGKPLDNTVIYLLDTQLKPVPIGEAGEIYVSGLNLAYGYVNGRDPDRFILNPHTVEPGLNRLYSTGDFGKIVKNEIVFEGRKDSQIKVRGHRVDLSEIDGVLQKLDCTDKSAVLCYKPGEVDQAIVAYITVKPGYNVTSQNVEELLANHLPSYSVPIVLIIKSIPLLINGKVDRQTLLKHYGESSCYKSIDDFDYSGVPEYKINAAQTLVKTVFNVLGSSLRGNLTLDSNFYHLGGNSLNSVYTVTKLKELGYAIGITDFVTAASLRKIIDRMLPVEQDANVTSEIKISDMYISEMLQEEHRSDITRMVTDSFYEKADLERWIDPIGHEDYYKLIDALWEALLQKRLCFIIKERDTGKAVGVSFNFDVHDEPEVDLNSKLQIVFEFLDYVEKPVKDEYLPQNKGQVLHSFMMATDKSLNPAENVSVIQFMEEEVLKLARSRGFTSIFTTNTSPLTQQLGTDVFGYKVLKEYTVNQYIAPDGSRPFKCAPDTQGVSVSWKLLNS